MKKFLIGLLILLAAFVIVSFLLPKPAPVVRSAEINTPVAVVFQQVNELRNWEKWSAWVEKDSTIETVYGEKTEGEGASYSWTGELVGSGSLTIIKSEPSESLNTEVDFGFMGRGNGSWTLVETNGETSVTWSMELLPGKGILAGIIGRYFLAFSNMDPVVGPDFEQGLANLKELCESKSVVIETTEVLGVKYYTIRGNVKWEDISQFYTDNYPKIIQKVQEDQMEMTGMPRGLYYMWDEENQMTEMAAAIPITPIPEEGRPKKTVDIGPGKAAVYDNYLVYDYYGNYDDMLPAHNGLEKAYEEVFKKHPEVVMEEYVTDPGAEPDTSKWLTRIFYVAN